MKRFTVLVIIAFVAALSLNALPMTVSWADGKVDLKNGSSWATVGMGDKIDSASTIRLEKGASVELSDGKRKVSLTAEGMYILDNLLKKGAVASKNNAAALNKLGKLVDPKAKVGATTVAAVRGAAVEPAKDTMAWQTDTIDIAVVMEEGRQLVRDGDYANAALKFNEAAEVAEGVEKDSAQYAEAWALAAADSSARAVKILRSMPSEGNWAGPRALLLARLDIDSGAKDEAKAVIDGGLAAKLFVGDEVELAAALLAEAQAE